MSDLIPEHILQSLGEAQTLFMLGEWKLKARPMNESDASEGRALTYVTPTIRTAIITFSEEVRAMSPDDPDLLRIITHEMLHVFFADVSEYLMESVFPKLYHPTAVDLARDGFRFLFEQKIDMLARLIMEKK